MTSKIRERLLNGFISVITVLVGVSVAFALSSGEGKSIRVERELKEKADLKYVDKQDAVIQNNLDTYKADHKDVHELDDKLDELSIDYLERMMDNLNIQYQDLKDEVDEGR